MLFQLSSIVGVRTSNVFSIAGLNTPFSQLTQMSSLRWNWQRYTGYLRIHLFIFRGKCTNSRTKSGCLPRSFILLGKFPQLYHRLWGWHRCSNSWQTSLINRGSLSRKPSRAPQHPSPSVPQAVTTSQLELALERNSIYQPWIRRLQKKHIIKYSLLFPSLLSH